jgi:hypothetical protein
VPGRRRSPAGENQGRERACPAGQRGALVSMGGGASRPDPGAHDRLLAEFSGSAAIDISDPFWAKMLRFPTPLTQLPPADVEAATAHHCEELGAGRARRRSRPPPPGELGHELLKQRPASSWTPHTLARAAVWPGVLEA